MFALGELQAQPQAPAGNLPNAPSSSKTEPSLQELGFPPDQTRANPKEQALLDKRTHMLKIHQRMGLITTVPLLATLVTSVGSGGKRTSNTDRNVHMVLGAVRGDLYFITAYYAIRAPRMPETKTRGPIRFHKAMAWIHGPGMILHPHLGGHGILSKKPRRKGPRDRGGAWAGGHCNRGGVWDRASVSLKF